MVFDTGRLSSCGLIPNRELVFAFVGGELRCRVNELLRLTAVSCALFVTCQTWAGTEVDGNTAVATTEKTEEAVPLDIFSD